VGARRRSRSATIWTATGGCGFAHPVMLLRRIVLQSRQIEVGRNLIRPHFIKECQGAGFRTESPAAMARTHHRRVLAWMPAMRRNATEG
jgi:hypothetical protein